METKAKTQKQSFIVDVPMNGHSEKWDVTPLTEIFDLISQEELTDTMLSLHDDCYEHYARLLEIAYADEDMKKEFCPSPDLLEGLYYLKVLIGQIKKCHSIEKSNAA